MRAIGNFLIGLLFYIVLLVPVLVVVIGLCVLLILCTPVILAYGIYKNFSDEDEDNDIE